MIFWVYFLFQICLDFLLSFLLEFYNFSFVIFTSTINFNLVCNVRYCLRFIFLIWISSCSSTIYSEDYHFLMDYADDFQMKNSFDRMCIISVTLAVYSWILYPVSMNHVFIFTQKPHYLDYCDFTVRLEQGSVSPPTLFFFPFHISLAIVKP